MDSLGDRTDLLTIITDTLLLDRYKNISNFLPEIEKLTRAIEYDPGYAKLTVRNEELIKYILSGYDLQSERVYIHITNFLAALFNHKECTQLLVVRSRPLFRSIIATVIRVATNMKNYENKVKILRLIVVLSYVSDSVIYITDDKESFESLFETYYFHDNELMKIYLIKLITNLVHAGDRGIINIMKDSRSNILLSVQNMLKTAHEMDLVEHILKLLKEINGCDIKFREPMELAQALLSITEKNSDIKHICQSAAHLCEPILEDLDQITEDFFYNFLSFFKMKQHLEIKHHAFEWSLIRMFTTMLRKNMIKPVPISSIWKSVKKMIEKAEHNQLTENGIESLSSRIDLASAYIELIDSLDTEDLFDVVYAVDRELIVKEKKEFYLGRLVCFNFVDIYALRSTIQLIGKSRHILNLSSAKLLKNLLKSLKIMLDPDRQFPEDLRCALYRNLFEYDIIDTIIKIKSNIDQHDEIFTQLELHGVIQDFLYELVSYLIGKEDSNQSQTILDRSIEVPLVHNINQVVEISHVQLFYYMVINYHGIKLGSRFINTSDIFATLNQFYLIENGLERLHPLLVKYLTFVTAYLSETSFHAFDDLFIHYWKDFDIEVVAETLSSDYRTLKWCLESDDFISRAGKYLLNSLMSDWSQLKHSRNLQDFVSRVQENEKVSSIFMECMVSQKNAVELVKYILSPESELNLTNNMNFTQMLNTSIPDILYKALVEGANVMFTIESMEQIHSLIDLLCILWVKQSEKQLKKKDGNMRNTIKISSSLVKEICCYVQPLYSRRNLDEISKKAIKYANEFFTLILDYDHAENDSRHTNSIKLAVFFDIKNLCTNFNGIPDESSNSAALYFYKLRLYQSQESIHNRDREDNNINPSNLRQHLQYVVEWFLAGSIEMIKVGLVTLRDSLVTMGSGHGLTNELISAVSYLMKLMCFNEELINDHIVTDIFRFLLEEKEEYSPIIRSNPLLVNFIEILWKQVKSNKNAARANQSCIILAAIFHSNFDNPFIENSVGKTLLMQEQLIKEDTEADRELLESLFDKVNCFGQHSRGRTLRDQKAMQNFAASSRVNGAIQPKHKPTEKNIDMIDSEPGSPESFKSANSINDISALIDDDCLPDNNEEVRLFDLDGDEDEENSFDQAKQPVNNILQELELQDNGILNSDGGMSGNLRDIINVSFKMLYEDKETQEAQLNQEEHSDYYKRSQNIPRSSYMLENLQKSNTINSEYAPTKARRCVNLELWDRSSRDLKGFTQFSKSNQCKKKK